MTETEKILRQELARAEGINDDLKRKLHIANQANYDLYRKTQELSFYIRQMERCQEETVQ